VHLSHFDQGETPGDEPGAFFWWAVLRRVLRGYCGGMLRRGFFSGFNTVASEITAE